jgi:predicted nucleotidyltransferase
MSQPEETYDEGRARNLEALLRALALRIQELDRQGRLLEEAGELMKLTGDIRSELFHYEVRITYDTPEVAENRRIVADAKKEKEEKKWEKTDWTPPDEEKDKEW